MVLSILEWRKLRHLKFQRMVEHAHKPKASPPQQPPVNECAICAITVRATRYETMY